MLLKRSKVVYSLLYILVVLSLLSTSSCEKIEYTNDKNGDCLTFIIEDERKETRDLDLNGKYISADNENIFIEIKDNEALLHKNFAEYLKINYDDVKEQKLVITEESNEIELYFNFVLKNTEGIPTAWFRTLNGDTNIFYWGVEDLYALKKAD